MKRETQNEHCQYRLAEIRTAISAMAHMKGLRPELRIEALEDLARYCNALAAIISSEN